MSISKVQQQTLISLLNDLKEFNERWQAVEFRLQNEKLISEDERNAAAFAAMLTAGEMASRLFIEEFAPLADLLADLLCIEPEKIVDTIHDAPALDKDNYDRTHRVGATILDLKTNEQEKVAEGDTVAGFQVLRVDNVKLLVQLKGLKADPITLKLKKKTP